MRLHRLLPRGLSLPATALLAAPPSFGQPPPPPPTDCAPCQNPSFVAYNRCAYWSIDDVDLPCDSIPVQARFRIDAASKKAAIRFTLSPTLSGDQTMRSVWLYYRTVGEWTNVAYQLDVCADSGGVPGTALVSAPIPPRPAGTVGWQAIEFPSPVEGLVPGNLVHLVVAPSGTPSPTECLELTVTRAGSPARFVPTDGTGISRESPCDRWLSVMLSDSSRGPTPGSDFFLVETEPNGGFTPVFAVDLGPSGLQGSPYDRHEERIIAGPNQYGQMIRVNQPTDVNYVSFWLRGIGCSEDCPVPPCPPGELEFRLLSAADPDAPPTALLPFTKVYRGRSHWMGAFFPTQHLEQGVYYLMLSSPQSTGTGTSGWVFSMETTTLPQHFNQLPTYLKGKSYAVQSNDGGASIVPLSRKGDTGFHLGYFPDGPHEIARLCDHSVSVRCGASNVFARMAAPGDVLVFYASNLNVGDSIGRLQYMRLLDNDCNPISQVRLCLDSGPVGPNMHAASRDIRWTMGDSDAYLWLEFGHEDPNDPSILVPDERFPIEIRKGCSPCTSCP